jgi:hypothetical protein
MIHHPSERALVDAFEFTGLRIVDQIEKRGEGIAQIEATPAPVADIEHAFEFFLERAGVVELRLLPAKRVAGGRFQVAFAA